MAYVVLTLTAVGLAIYGLVDCWNSSEEEMQVLPKPVWMTLLLVPLAGGLLWVTFGRTRAGMPAGPGRRYLAPDDDPDFLRSLDVPRPKTPEPGPDEPRDEPTGQGDQSPPTRGPRAGQTDPENSGDTGSTPHNGREHGDPGPRLG